jgi:hypothetical protein
VQSDRITGEAQARDVLNNEILKTFIAQINTLKSASVRNSRLTNQTRDLKNLFETEVIPAVTAQKARQLVNAKLLPEFASGGFFRGQGLAMLHDGEIIMNKMQQSRLIAMTSPSVFQAVGVPNAPKSYNNGVPQFETGGVFRAGGSVSNTNNEPIQLNVTLMVSPEFSVETSRRR